MSKKALVTGASEGIGQAIARRLKEEGYLVTSVARSADKLKTFTAELGSGHDLIVADLSTVAGQGKIADALEKGNYNLLINNAGVGTVGAFTEVPLEKQMAMLSLNAAAVVRLAYAFLKNAKSGDALVNVSSALAFMPMPGMGLYSATKSFVTAFSDTLWYEQKKRGVYVMGLHPGITATNFQVAAGGRKEDLPSHLAQTSEQVADICIKELRARRKPTVISGGKNVIFAGTSRILPRKSIVNMTGKMMEK
ncbi:MAG TPA: SDR family NAD(P)-dependent oxidoreductase [Patescibacteria group bacterium]|nr:SDR family NAD(P)-dependent oxidoreductase [Patescibacteria group bacterium]